MSDWNPLYPFDDDADSLEEAAREAEWEDDTRKFAEKRRRRRKFTDDNDSEEAEDPFL